MSLTPEELKERTDRINNFNGPVGIVPATGSSLRLWRNETDAGLREPVSFPMPMFSKALRASHGLCVVAGSPSSCKSWLALNLAIQCYRNKTPWAGLFLEGSQIETETRALSIFSGSFDPLENGKEWSARHEELIQKHGSEVDEFVRSGLTINPRTLKIVDYQGLENYQAVTYGMILNWITKHTEGKKVLIIDNLSAMDTEINEASKRYQIESAFVKALELLAENILIVLVVHLVKRNAAERKSQLSMDHIQGAAQITKSAPYLIGLEFHKSRYSSVAAPSGTTEAKHTKTAHIIKTRNGPAQGMQFAFELVAGGSFLEYGAVREELDEADTEFDDTPVDINYGSKRALGNLGAPAKEIQEAIKANKALT